MTRLSHTLAPSLGAPSSLRLCILPALRACLIRQAHVKLKRLYPLVQPPRSVPSGRCAPCRGRALGIAPWARASPLTHAAPTVRDNVAADPADAAQESPTDCLATLRGRLS
jgi:hypothetical protein